MPSPEHAADLERVLTRAARECESGDAWFGEGLPRALRSALEAAGRVIASDAGGVAFVDAGALCSTPLTDVAGSRVVVLSDCGLDDLQSLIESAQSSALSVARIICPFAVFDLSRDGLRVREIRHGLTAADLQAKLTFPLWAGPDLQQLE